MTIGSVGSGERRWRRTLTRAAAVAAATAARAMSSSLGSSTSTSASSAPSSGAGPCAAADLRGFSQAAQAGMSARLMSVH
eukprot:scaffold3945_cov105-Isochrysis_galbana.AAC.18